MFKRVLLLISMLLFAIAAHAESPDQVVNEVMQAYLQKHEVPGAAILLVVDGKAYSYYYGYADRETKKPVTKDTIFELGSLTKLMTTLLIAQDVDFAKIKLKDPINKYIPTLPASFGDVSVRSLATHTSGLPFKVPAEVTNRVEWEKYAATLTPEDIDSEYAYSNIGIGLLGQALETVSHQNFNQLFRGKILSPLGMQPIAFTVPKKLEPFYARGYNAEGLPQMPEKMGLFPAAGDAKASAGDMSKFLSAAIGLPSTPESIFYPMRMTQTPYVATAQFDQGLGWQIHELKSDKIKALLVDDNKVTEPVPLPVLGVYADPVFNGNALIDKTGATDGFRVYIAVIPNKRTGIVILTNKRILGSPIAKAGREILFKLNGIL